MTIGFIYHLYSKLRDVLENGCGSFFGSDGRSDYAVYIVGRDESFKFIEEEVEADSVVLADLKSGINENVGNVMVACENACDKSVKGLSILNEIFFGVDKTAAIVDIKLQLVTFFDTNNGTVGGVESFIDKIDESLGLAGTFFAYD